MPGKPLVLKVKLVEAYYREFDSSYFCLFRIEGTKITWWAEYIG